MFFLLLFFNPWAKPQVMQLFLNFMNITQLATFFVPCFNYLRHCVLQNLNFQNSFYCKKIFLKFLWKMDNLKWWNRRRILFIVKGCLKTDISTINARYKKLYLRCSIASQICEKWIFNFQFLSFIHRNNNRSTLGCLGRLLSMYTRLRRRVLHSK